MADKEQDPTARSEREIEEQVITQGDKVFFPGTALVDDRTDEAIDAAIEEKARIAAIQSSVEMTGEEEGELGDTRTSASKKAASKKKGK